jgi:hypothetical protein
VAGHAALIYGDNMQGFRAAGHRRLGLGGLLSRIDLLLSRILLGFFISRRAHVHPHALGFLFALIQREASPSWLGRQRLDIFKAVTLGEVVDAGNDKLIGSL